MNAKVHLLHPAAVAVALVIAGVFAAEGLGAPAAELNPELEDALLAIDKLRLSPPQLTDQKPQLPEPWLRAWREVIRLCMNEEELKASAAQRAILAHALLAVNESNGSLALFLSVATDERRASWKAWAARFAKSHPTSTTAMYLLGDACSRVGEAERASVAFDGATNPWSGKMMVPASLPLAYNARGVCNILDRSYEDREEDFTRACELAPWLADAWANRGTLKLRDKAYPDAILDYEIALELAPDSSLAKNGLACALVWRGHMATVDRDAEPSENTTKGPEAEGDGRKAERLFRECVNDPVIGSLASANLTAIAAAEVIALARTDAAAMPGTAVRTIDQQGGPGRPGGGSRIDGLSRDLASTMIHGRPDEVNHRVRDLARTESPDTVGQVMRGATKIVANAAGEYNRTGQRATRLAQESRSDRVWVETARGTAQDVADLANLGSVAAGGIALKTKDPRAAGTALALKGTSAVAGIGARELGKGSAEMQSSIDQTAAVATRSFDKVHGMVGNVKQMRATYRDLHPNQYGVDAGKPSTGTELGIAVGLAAQTPKSEYVITTPGTERGDRLAGAAKQDLINRGAAPESIRIVPRDQFNPERGNPATRGVIKINDVGNDFGRGVGGPGQSPGGALLDLSDGTYHRVEWGVSTWFGLAQVTSLTDDSADAPEK